MRRTVSDAVAENPIFVSLNVTKRTPVAERLHSVSPIPALPAWPRLCAGTVITRNARSAPPLRALDLDVAIGPPA